MARLVPFLQAGIAADEPTLVVVGAHKIDALRDALGPGADAIEFADMQDVGANPARIIPAWEEFVEAHPGRRTRGIGEPIFPERNPAELAECQHHERLLNPALAGSELFLVCPYDTAAMPPDVIDEARRSHPIEHRHDANHAIAAYSTDVARNGLLSEPLPEPDNASEPFRFEQATLAVARSFVMRHAFAAGLDQTKLENLVLATGELASNSVRHGGGRGSMRVWRENNSVVCEIRDHGRILDPLVDRRRPGRGQKGGWGLWIANQVCDLVQLRSLPGGVVARLHVTIA
ncbi:MAG: hypothetical protein QOI64_641 [Solirubrobacteraceae bacterium]|nr:hypothetical protein [Solirubrobacteraceae bacterium]